MLITNKNRQAFSYGLATIFLWSTMATAFSLALDFLLPSQLLLIATLTSFLFLLGVVIIRQQLKTLWFCLKQTWKTSLLFGTINPFIYYLVLLTAYDLLPAQEAQAINYTWAIVLSLFTVPIMKQKLTAQDLVAVVVCYCGVLFIATQGDPLSLTFSNLEGVLMALLSTLIWPLYWLFSAKDTRPALIGLTINFMFSVPMILFYCFATNALSSWPKNGVFAGIYIGLFEMGLSFILWNQALKLADKASKIANLIFLSPLLSLIWLSQFTDEPIQWFTLVGLACILIGLSIQNFYRTR